jgi:hypothetical protein
MQNLQRFFRSSMGSRTVRTPVSILLFIAATVTFYFVWASAGRADDTNNVCMVCHLRKQTLTLTCNSIDYLRHKDHKDPDGPCSASQ